MKNTLPLISQTIWRC